MGEAIVGGDERRNLERTYCLSLVGRLVIPQPVIPRLVILWPSRPNALSLLLEKFPGQQVCRWNGLEPGMSVVDLRADDGGELVEDLARNPTDVDGAGRKPPQNFEYFCNAPGFLCVIWLSIHGVEVN